MSQNEPQQVTRPAPLSPPRPRRPWLTLLLTAVVFVSGLAVGSGLTFLYIEQRREYYLAHTEEAPKRFADRLRRTLGLSDEQTRQVQAIITERWPMFQETRRQVYPLFREHLDALEAQVETILHGQQVQKWHDYVARIRGLWNPTGAATSPSLGPGAPASQPQAPPD